MDKFKLLCNRDILAILDGDAQFGTIQSEEGGQEISISMPYLSGSDICSIANKFGCPMTYGGMKSRWEYLKDLIIFCIKNERVVDLLSYLFSKQQFSSKLSGLTSELVENTYKKIITSTIEHINGELCSGGHELVLIGGTFAIHEIGKTVSVEAPVIKIIDRSYISDLCRRALQSIETDDFDSAVTKSRTLLEEVFCYVIERKGQSPADKGDIKGLYNEVKKLYHMHQDKDTDKRINMLLSGLEKILSAITEMRNKSSDSHGIGAHRINIAEHHARLCVNAAVTMADFILAVSEKQCS